MGFIIININKVGGLRLENKKIGSRMRRRRIIEKRRKRRTFTIFLTLLTIFILIFYFSYLRNCLFKPGKETEQEPTIASESEEETSTETEEELVFSGRRSFLIVGSDNSINNISPNSVILISYNSISEEILMISIPLQTLLQFNEAAVTVRQLLIENNIEDLKLALKNSLGIEIDNYILIDIFNVVEKIGGITVDIPESISFPDIKTKVTVSFEKGEMNLSGDLAISYLHYTSGEGVSILQVSDQQDVYLSILNKLMANKSFSEISEEIQLVSEYLSSDFNDVELISIGSSITRSQESKIFKDKTLPISVVEIDGNKYYIPQTKKISEILGEFVQFEAAEEIEKANIIILNGCGSLGIANSLGNKIQQDFQIVELGNAANFQHTETKIIITVFDLSIIEDAISLRENIGIGKIITNGNLTQETKQKADIVIIIGSDYLPLA